MIDDLEDMWKEMHFVVIDLFMSGNKTDDRQDRQIRYKVLLRCVRVTMVDVEKK